MPRIFIAMNIGIIECTFYRKNLTIQSHKEGGGRGVSVFATLWSLNYYIL